jgi:ribosomal protein L5
LGLKSYEIFHEIHPDKITIPTGLQITIGTQTVSKEHTKALMQEF